MLVLLMFTCFPAVDCLTQVDAQFVPWKEMSAEVDAECVPWTEMSAEVDAQCRVPGNKRKINTSAK